MEHAIEVSRLCKSYGRKSVLRDVSFEARAGRVTAFLGPNGAGKSTTLRILLGLDRASSGTATIGGTAYDRLARLLRIVGASFEDVGAPDDRTVAQHLRIAAASNGIERGRIGEVQIVSDFMRCTHGELLKLVYSKETRIVAALVLFLQSMLAYLSGRQVLAMGLYATPETNGSLLEAIPPIEYLGFDAVVFGLLPMVVLGALHGAGEYRRHSMRTTLLCNGRRGTVLLSKMATLCCFSLALSLAAAYASIAATHVALGDSGLHPLLLSPAVRERILHAALAWTALSALSFAIGFLFRMAIIPLLFLIPQVYNLGNLLAERFAFGGFLPVALGNGLIATSPTALAEAPAASLGLLVLWVLAAYALACLRFLRSDMGGEC